MRDVTCVVKLFARLLRKIHFTCLDLLSVAKPHPCRVVKHICHLGEVQHVVYVTHLYHLALHHNRLLINVLPQRILSSLLQSGKLFPSPRHLLNHHLLLLHSLSPDTDPMLN